MRVRAPFAAFRWMQAGVYRATAPVIPPSAAWGLILNLAGMETRVFGEGVTTLIRDDAPALRLAIGALNCSPSMVATLYQQLHSYPVGNSGKEFKERAYGAKYWIAPARRELIVNFDTMIGFEAKDSTLVDRVRDGLSGRFTGPRYGLPFAGDNNLLIDRIDLLDAPPSIYWYERLEPAMGPRRGSCRLTIGIDREDSSRTTSLVFAPIDSPVAEPPEGAWIWTPRSPE